MKKNHNYVVVVILCVAFLTGCATIMQGTTQGVGISSTPTGAKVSVDNLEKGSTPLVVELKRKDNHIIKIEMAGYFPHEATLTRSTSGWIWGNLAFGGLIGLVVDAMTGGMYKLEPKEIAAVLRDNKQGAIHNNDMLFVAVVLEADPAWEKIGQLERIK
jgi:uncharacterized protein YceK